MTKKLYYTFFKMRKIKIDDNKIIYIVKGLSGSTEPETPFYYIYIIVRPVMEP